MTFGLGLHDVGGLGLSCWVLFLFGGKASHISSGFSVKIPLKDLYGTTLNPKPTVLACGGRASPAAAAPG